MIMDFVNFCFVAIQFFLIYTLSKEIERIGPNIIVASAIVLSMASNSYLLLLAGNRYGTKEATQIYKDGLHKLEKGTIQIDELVDRLDGKDNED